MTDLNGHIELERAVDSIVVGIRHRKDLGDLGPLMKSIEQRGLLQPITITPDGVLVCGRRRLEAVKRLGWRTLRVWVRSGISDELSQLLAQQDENELHKPLTPLEEAALYEELSKLLAEDAARRQEATRFGGAGDLGGESGGEDSSPPGTLGEVNGGEDSSPPSGRRGKTREQASKLLTGMTSFQRLDQINTVKRATTDRRLPSVVRDLAAKELRNIENGADVAPAFHRVKAAIELADGGFRSDTPTPEDLETLAAEAVERVKQERARGGGHIRARRSSPPSRRSVRAFLLTWGDLDGWSRYYNPNEIAAKLKDSDWEMFERVLAETIAFADEVRELRAAPSTVSA
jgi:ParB family chromosome partitioning protein